MKRKIVFLLILFGLLGLVLGFYRLVSDRVPKQGILRIDARPQVGVFLDNRQLANSPLEVKIDRGEFTVKLVSQSNLQPVASWQGKVKIAPNLLTYINADLAATEFESAVETLWLEKSKTNQAEIAVTSTPDGAAVSFNGQSMGVTPLVLADVKPGDHDLSLSAVGFVPRSLKVRVTAGYRLIVAAKMALSTRLTGLSDEASQTSQMATSSVLSPTMTVASPSATIMPTVTKNSTPMPTEKIVAKPYVLISDTPTGFLRVRFNPTTQATESGKVYPGETYPYLTADNGWYKIRYQDNKEGWIFAQYAELFQ